MDHVGATEWRERATRLGQRATSGCGGCAGRVVPELEQRPDGRLRQPVTIAETASGWASRRRLFAASHPPAMCRGGSVVVGGERHGRRWCWQGYTGRSL